VNAGHDPPLPPRYRDVEAIGRGGMGDIFRAVDTELGRTVAIKLLAERFARDEQLRARFRREALAAARVSANPHIVTIFDVAESDGRPLIVMEYLPGGSLDDRVRGRAPCAVPQVLAWLDQAAAALDAAHDAGVVHRDVKPGNLLLDERDQVKVGDFGIASAAGLDSFTKTGTILGTAGYLSPEQAVGERATPASDRYSLAVVAWELLVGRRPFEAENATAEALAHANAPIPRIQRANPALPTEYDAVFRRGLAKAPAERFGSAAELVGALRRATEDAAGATLALDAWPAPAPARGRPAPPPPSQPSRRRLWPALLLLGLLLAAGAAAAYLATRDSPRAIGSRTVVRTVTGPGSTVQQTVTVSPTTPTTSAPAPAGGGDGSQLNDEGFAKMRAGDLHGALPLLEQAVAQLQGTGSLTEAYADFNLAFTRFALGDCTDVLALLERSEQIQGRRPPIDRLRRDAERRC
jgi:eukaryotic-like serine/threonine-protein kinase